MARLIELLWESHANDDYPRYWPADAARFVISPGETGAWVAEQDGMVVGHVALHKASGDPTYEIAHRVTGLGANSLAVVARLFTDGAFRRRGVGRALIEHATVAAHADGRRPVLDVGQCLPAAIALYEAAGWTRLDGFRLEVRQGSLNLWVYLGPPP